MGTQAAAIIAKWLKPAVQARAADVY